MPDLLPARKLLFWLLAGLLLLGFPPGRAAAQTSPPTPAGVKISQIDTSDDTDTLLLDISFTLRDADGQIIPNGRILAAQVTVDDGGTFDARVARANKPAYIALLLDISGSMADVAEQMRATAVQAVATAPAGTFFSVVTFDQEITLLQPFTNDTTQVLNAINSVQIGNGGTCLIDVTYTAVQSMEQVAPNGAERAIFLFTDGRDELTRGLGDTCSQNSVQQLVTQANRPSTSVPIHAVAFSGSGSPANEEALQVITSANGSLAQANESADLTPHFSSIMAALNSQWQARANVYTPEGIHAVALFITLEDGTVIAPGSGLFVADRTYTTPQEEQVAVTVTNFKYDPLADQYNLEVSLVNPGRVGQLRVEVWDQESNLQVDRLIYNNLPGKKQTILINTNALEARGIYTIRVYPLDRLGSELPTLTGSVLVADHPFQYLPPQPVTFRVEAVRFDQETQSTVLDLSIVNGERITSFDGRVINRSDNTESSNFGPYTRVGDLVFLPLPDQAGEYQTIINGRDSSGTVVASTTYDYVYTPPDNIWQRALTALQQNPLLSILGSTLLLTTIVLEAVILLFFFRKFAAQAATPAGTTTATAGQGAAGGPMRPGSARLRIERTLNPNFTGHESEIMTVPFTVGRESADLTITGDRQISREHIAITYHNNVFYVTDQRSSNGTFVNGQQLTPNVALALAPGTLINLGQNTQLVFMTVPLPAGDEPAAEGAPEPAAQPA